MPAGGFIVLIYVLCMNVILVRPIAALTFSCEASWLVFVILWRSDFQLLLNLLILEFVALWDGEGDVLLSAELTLFFCDRYPAEGILMTSESLFLHALNL